VRDQLQERNQTEDQEQVERVPASDVPDREQAAAAQGRVGPIASSGALVPMATIASAWVTLVRAARNRPALPARRRPCKARS